jgi:hypothetical protein
MSHRLAFWVLSPLWWTGCVCTPGPVARRPAGANARVVGCLNIAVGVRRDPVLTFDVANTCPHPVAVEFRNVVVRAWSEDRTEHRPAPWDPRSELFQAQIDGHDRVRVVLDFPVSAATPHFCVDVARLNVDGPAPHPVELCFRSDGGGNFVSDSLGERWP